MTLPSSHHEDSSKEEASRKCIRREMCSMPLVVLVSGKLWTYGGLRFLYPMSEFLAKDWDLSSTQMSAVLAMGEFVPAGFFSSAGDVLGPRKLAVFSFVALCISSSGMLLPPTFPSLLIFRFMYGFGLFLFQVSAQTSATSEVPSDARDCITGVLEMPYSMSALALVPILSVTYQSGGWRAPFIVIAVMITIHLPYLLYLAYWRRVGTAAKVEIGEDDDDECAEQAGSPEGISSNSSEQPGSEAVPKPVETVTVDQSAIPQSAIPNQREGLRAGIRWHTGALTFNLSGLCLTAAVNLLATEFGFLLHSYFGLKESDAGTASLVMGLAELTGVMLASIATSAGSLPMEIAGVLLFVFILVYSYVGSTTLPLSLTGLFLVFLLGEYGTVQRLSRAPLFASTEDASAMLGMHVQFQVFGRTIGAAIAAQLFFRSDENLLLGHAVCCWVAAAFALLMTLFLRASVIQQAKYQAMKTSVAYTGV